MELVRTRAEVRKSVAAARAAGKTIGLVPTMGYFHQGHLELMKIAGGRADYVVVSLFVNPTQFGPGEDLERYPRDEKRDAELAAGVGVDLLFAPLAGEMYAPDKSTVVEETVISQGLCSASRPGHFRGVTTVVAKLFNIIQPDLAVFGRKDLQQITVIRRMVRDLDFPLEVVEAPIVREPDGLAMSSRNVYLSPAERTRAPGMHATLLEAAREIAAGGAPADVLGRAWPQIERRTGGSLEYLEALDSGLGAAQSAGQCSFLAAALKLGKTRLIDNVRIPPGLSGD